jgi:hypothetical protein
MNLKDKDKTIVGYTLLIIGLILMFYSIISVIGVFNGGDMPIGILQEGKDSDNNDVDLDQNSGNSTAPDIDLGKIIEPLFPMFNVMLWLIIAFFILMAGARVARIGILMLRASLPDVTIIKQDVKDIKDSYSHIEDFKPVKKEKKGFFRRKNK